jgi:hypothetical protein
MQKRTSWVLGFLIVLFFGASLVLAGDLSVCPIHSTDNATILDPPQEETLTLGKSPSVPRNQVLLEVFGRTT